MDKKILMLGLVISGNVFGMQSDITKQDLVSRYCNLVERTLTELVPREEIAALGHDIKEFSENGGYDIRSSSEISMFLCDVELGYLEKYGASTRYERFNRILDISIMGKEAYYNIEQ